MMFHIRYIGRKEVKRKFTETVLQKTQNRTSDKKSGEYAAIPLKIVRSNTSSIIFIEKMTIFLITFLTKF